MPKDKQNPIEPIESDRLRVPSESARVFGLSRSMIYNLLRDGKIAYVRLPGGTRRVPDSAVRAWIASSLVKSA